MSYFSAVDELQIAQISNPDECLISDKDKHILKDFKNRMTGESSGCVPHFLGGVKVESLQTSI